MASYEPIKTILLENKSYLEKKYHVSKIAIFGSFARGESEPDSDIDILVEFSSPIGLDFVTLADELESMLQHKIDLVPANAVKPKMMQHIREDIVYV
jgi:predicted nucleotidyltransferase